MDVSMPIGLRPNFLNTFNDEILIILLYQVPHLNFPQSIAQSIHTQYPGTITTALSRTIVHEVAHGLFTLRHTFREENTYILSQGTTDNLMDYSGQEATALYKYQWDLIHNPQRVYYPFSSRKNYDCIRRL